VSIAVRTVRGGSIPLPERNKLLSVKRSRQSTIVANATCASIEKSPGIVQARGRPRTTDRVSEGRERRKRAGSRSIPTRPNLSHAGYAGDHSSGDSCSTLPVSQQKKMTLSQRKNFG